MLTVINVCLILPFQFGTLVAIHKVGGKKALNRRLNLSIDAGFNSIIASHGKVMKSLPECRRFIPE